MTDMAMFKSFRITVEPFMFLCMKAFFLNLVALPQLILDNVCIRKHNQTKCAAMLTGAFKKEYDMVQEDATFWFAGVMVIATFITVLTLPFVASLSDEFGRRRIMFLTPLSQLIQCVAFLLIVSKGIRFPTWLILIAGPIPGLVGDVSSLYVFTHAYIADITTEKQRTMRINLLEAASLSAGLCATVSSGHIIQRFGYVGIFVTSTGLLVLAIIYLIVVVKPVESVAEKVEGKRELDIPNQECDHVQEGNIREGGTVNIACIQSKTDTIEKTEGKVFFIDASKSLSNNSHKENIENSATRIEHSANQGIQAPQSKLSRQDKGLQRTTKRLLKIVKKSNPLTSVKRVIKVLKEQGQLKKGLTLFLLMSFGAFSYSGEMAIIVLYLKNHPYFLTPQKIGYFLAFESALLAIVGLVCWNYLLTRIIKISDVGMLLVTSFSALAYYVLLGFSNSITMLYLIQILHSVSTLNVSTIRAMTSKVTTPSAVGLMYAALLVVETASILVGSIVTPLTYALVAAVHPGAAFFINAGIMLTSLCISISLVYV